VEKRGGKSATLLGAIIKKKKRRDGCGSVCGTSLAEKNGKRKRVDQGSSVTTFVNQGKKGENVVAVFSDTEESGLTGKKTQEEERPASHTRPELSLASCGREFSREKKKARKRWGLAFITSPQTSKKRGWARPSNAD